MPASSNTVTCVARFTNPSMVQAAYQKLAEAIANGRDFWGFRLTSGFNGGEHRPWRAEKVLVFEVDSACRPNGKADGAVEELFLAAVTPAEAYSIFTNPGGMQALRKRKIYLTAIPFRPTPLSESAPAIPSCIH